MKCYTANEIRNIGIFGHGGEGKTTLTEAMLYNAGLVDRFPNNAPTTDFDPEEVKRSISINMVVGASLAGVRIPFPPPEKPNKNRSSIGLFFRITFHPKYLRFSYQKNQKY